MRVQQRIYYLEMASPAELRPSQHAGAGLEIRQAAVVCPELNRFLYTAVGGDWFWVDRLGWTYQQWLDYLGRPGFETWLAYVSGTPAGYFELDADGAADVEIASFGLLPQFVGQHFGGPLLTFAVQRAWQTGATRVWLHTCSHDHPRALANYQARGFRLFREETEWRDMSAAPPGPWPGAGKCMPG